MRVRALTGFTAALLASLPIAGAAAIPIDAVQLPRLAAGDTRLFLDDIESAGLFEAGVPPQRGGRLTLAPGTSTLLLLPAEEALSLEADARGLLPEVWVGDGRGLEMRTSLRSAGGGRHVLDPTSDERWVRLAAPAGGDERPVRVFVTRTEAPPPPVAYRLGSSGASAESIGLRHVSGGIEVSTGALHEAGAEPAVLLPRGETLVLEARQATRLSIEQRARVPADGADRILDWTLELEAKPGHTALRTLRGGIDVDGIEVDGQVESWTVARSVRAAIGGPESDRGGRLSLRATRDLLLVLRSAQPGDVGMDRLGTRAADALTAPAPPDAFGLDAESARDALDDAGTDPERAAAAVERLAAEPLAAPPLTAAVAALGAGSADSPVPTLPADLARETLRDHGVWRDIDLRATDPLGMRELAWTSRVPRPRREPPADPVRLPEATLDALATDDPSARFVQLEQPVILSRPHPDAPLRLRMLVAGDAPAAFTLTAAGSVHHLRTCAAAPHNRAPARQLALADRLVDRGPLTVAGLRAAQGGAPLPEPVRAVELSLPPGTGSLRLEATRGAPWVAIQARDWRLPEIDADALRLILDAGPGPAVARKALARVGRGAAPSLGDDRWSRALASLAAWLAARRERFAQRSAPRPASGAPAPGPLATDASVPERVRHAIARLDAHADPVRRLDAARDLVAALEAAREPFLIENSLRGMVLFEQAAGTWAARRLSTDYRAAADLDAEVTLRAAVFARHGDVASAAALARALAESGDTHRALLLATLMPDDTLPAATVASWRVADGAQPDDDSDADAVVAARRALLRGDETTALAQLRSVTGDPGAQELADHLRRGLELRTTLADGADPDERQAWAEWWAVTPGPWDWRPSDGAVRRAAGWRRLVNEGTGAMLAVATLPPEGTITLHGARPGPLRVTAFPWLRREQLEDGASGTIEAVDASGASVRIRFDDAPASATLAVADGPLPARSSTLVLPHPGPWTLRAPDTGADVRVEERTPRHAPGVLPPPDATALALAGRSFDQAGTDHAGFTHRILRSLARPPARGSVAWRWPRDFAVTGLPTPLTSLPDPLPAPVPDDHGAPAMVPVPAGADPGVRPAPASRAQARTRIRTLLGELTRPGADAVALHRSALAITRRFPDDAGLAALHQRVAASGRWQRLDLVEASAGFVEKEHSAAAGTGLGESVRIALLGAAGDAQRHLADGRMLEYASESPHPRTLEVALTTRRAGWFAPRGARVRLKTPDGARTLSLAALSTERTRVRLPDGVSRLRVALENPHPDSWVSVHLREVGTTRNLQWSIGRRFHAATPGEPVVALIPGPAILRIERDGIPLPTYRDLGPGSHPVVLSAQDAPRALYRLYRWVPAPERPPADTTRTVRARSATVPSVPRAPAAPARPWPDPATAMIANRATWSLNAEWTSRTPLEEDVAGKTNERFTELGLDRRRRLPSGTTWDHSRLLVRLREVGAPVLGVRHRREHRLPVAGLGTFLSGSLHVQRPETRDGGRQDAEWAAHLSAGVDQRRRLGPRSTHTPFLDVFGRSLSLDDTRDLDPDSVDQDLFTEFKADHRYGLRFGDVWRFDPTRRLRLQAGTNALLNENARIDRIAVDAGADRLFGNVAVRTEWRLRHFREDEDRRAATTIQRLAIDIEWHRLGTAWRHWEADLEAVYDLDAEAFTLGLRLHRHLGRGRGLRDFRPGVPRFTPARRLRFPPPEGTP